MRVGWTGPVVYSTGQSRKVTVKHVWIYILGGRLVLSPSYFSQDFVLSGFCTGI